MIEGAEDKEGNPIKIKPRKTKMCESFLKGKTCTEKDEKCKFAHFAHELELVSVNDKVKNLKGVIESQTTKMKHSKPPLAFKPASQGGIEDPTVF